MIFSEEELLGLNKRGLIPGPSENEPSFKKRVNLALQFAKNPQIFFESPKDVPFSLKNPVAYHDWEWPLVHVKKLFDIAPDWLVGFYQDRGLSFAQGAQTWIFEKPETKHRVALLQFRSQLKRGSYLKIYSRDELLSHEAVHAARVAFDEPMMEELLAYATSRNGFRRVLGPIIQKPLEVFLFFGILSCALVSQFLWIFANISVFESIFHGFLLLSGGVLALAFARLFRTNLIFRNVYGKLLKIFKEPSKVRAVIFRLTDSEMRKFFKYSLQEIQEYALRESRENLRWKVLRLAYFSSEQKEKKQ